MIDPTKFEAQGKPTVEQAQTVYNALPHQTVDTLHAKLVGLGYSISRATTARWIRSGFTPRHPTNLDKGEIKGVPAVVRDTERLIGGPLGDPEVADLTKDMLELSALDTPQLKALLEVERLKYNIMMLRAATRKADKLVLIPKDSAAFVVAMTDASSSLSAIAPGQLPAGQPGDNAKLIDATANPPNPVAEAIASFKRRQVAA